MHLGLRVLQLAQLHVLNLIPQRLQLAAIRRIVCSTACHTEHQPQSSA
jgi:hypothetical protein